MRIEQLEYLISISNTGSFSLSAEKLHITQPTISQAINSLEKELGVRIFERSRHGAEPTTDGKVVLKKALEIMSKFNELKDEVQLRSTSITGNLKIAIVPGICSTLLPKTLANYKEKLPLVNIEIIEGGSLEIMNGVLTGSIDMGVIAIPKGSWQNHKSLIFEELLPTKVKVCVGKNFNHNNSNEIMPEEIIQHPIIMYKTGYNMSQFIINLLSDYGELKVLFTSDNTEVAKKVIAEGIAIGFYSEVALRSDPYVVNGDLIILDIQNEAADTSFGWIRSKNRHFSKAAEEFINELKLQANLYE